jgi:hypothetical protein
MQSDMPESQARERPPSRADKVCPNRRGGLLGFTLQATLSEKPQDRR